MLTFKRVVRKCLNRSDIFFFEICKRISTNNYFITGTPDCYTGVRTRFSIIGRNIENVKITDNWKNTFTKRLLTFLTVEKCGKLPWKFAKNSFTSTNLKRLIMPKWLNCIIECLHFMTISWIPMNLEGSQSISGKIIYELFLALMKLRQFDHSCGVFFLLVRP